MRVKAELGLASARRTILEPLGSILLPREKTSK